MKSKYKKPNFQPESDEEVRLQRAAIEFKCCLFQSGSLSDQPISQEEENVESEDSFDDEDPEHAIQTSSDEDDGDENDDDGESVDDEEIGSEGEPVDYEDAGSESSDIVDEDGVVYPKRAEKVREVNDNQNSDSDIGEDSNEACKLLTVCPRHVGYTTYKIFYRLAKCQSLG